MKVLDQSPPIRLPMSICTYLWAYHIRIYVRIDLGMSGQICLTSSSLLHCDYFEARLVVVPRQHRRQDFDLKGNTLAKGSHAPRGGSEGVSSRMLMKFKISNRIKPLENECWYPYRTIFIALNDSISVGSLIKFWKSMTKNTQKVCGNFQFYFNFSLPSKSFKKFQKSGDLKSIWNRFSN